MGIAAVAVGAVGDPRRPEDLVDSVCRSTTTRAKLQEQTARTRPTCRRVALHTRLIAETDLADSIILSSDGRVMDGMHRVCRALIEGRETIRAIRFDVDPEPDYVDVAPEDLPY